MHKFPLAIITHSLGKPSETFITKHMIKILPSRTAVVAREVDPAFNIDDVNFPFLLLGKFKGTISDLLKFSYFNPALEEVAFFLLKHEVKVVLSQYLDLTLRWIPLKKKYGIKLFAHAHGYDISIRLRQPRKRKHYLKYKNIDGVITVSEYSRRKLVDLGLPEKNIHVIPCGVDVPNIFRQRENNSIIRFLAVGRMVAKKAPLITIQAFHNALLTQPNIHLDYIGDGIFFEKVQEYIDVNNLGKYVRLHGSQPNSIVQDFMAQADVFLQHSMTDPITGDEEGLPVAILEAMAEGLPVISTYHAGIPEAVIHEKSGFLVREKDIQGTSKYICKLANSHPLRLQLGVRGYERAKENFSWEKERKSLVTLMGL